MLPKVSVIIPFYNCLYVAEAIESVRAQTYPNVEIVIVNDGSTQYKERVTPYFHLPNVVYVEKGNGGTASALNMGIRYSTGSYIAWLSADDLFATTKIERQMKFMEENSASISYTNFNLIDASGFITEANVGLHFDNQKDFLQYLPYGCIVNGSTVIVKRDVFHSIGLFDESLKYTQDYEFWMRAAQHYQLFSLNETLVNYRVHDGMGSRKHRPEQDYEAYLVKERHKEALARVLAKLL